MSTNLLQSSRVDRSQVNNDLAARDGKHVGLNLHFPTIVHPIQSIVCFEENDKGISDPWCTRGWYRNLLIVWRKSPYLRSEFLE